MRCGDAIPGSGCPWRSSAGGRRSPWRSASRNVPLDQAKPKSERIAVIDRLLLAQLEQPDFEPVRRTVQFAALLLAIVEERRPLASRAAVTLTTRTDGASLRVEAYPERLRQAVGNLGGQRGPSQASGRRRMPCSRIRPAPGNPARAAASGSKERSLRHGRRRSSMRGRFLNLWIVLILVAALAAACGGSPAPSTGGGAEPDDRDAVQDGGGTADQVAWEAVALGDLP